MNLTLENVSIAAQLRGILDRIVPNDALHAKLLNTMSYMEHIGATKIALTQSGPQADFMSLKHAAEEARHAYYLKKLSRKLAPDACPDYSDAFLLAPIASRQYLYRLDLQVSRSIRQAGLSGRKLHQLAYLLVTYAIELRADEIYPIYQEYLTDLPLKLSVQGIINEEEGHLAEMETALAEWPESLQALKVVACEYENRLYTDWLNALQMEIDAMPQASLNA